jgi:acetyl-CoA/propionyl-CoA carboxylase biotin carboxyl carrier protein
VLGVTTTTGYLRGLIADPDVQAGRLDTGLVERRGVPAGPMGDAGVAVAAAMLVLAQRGHTAGDDPFARVDGWRIGGRRAGSHWRLSVGGGEPVDVEVSADNVAMVTALGDDRFTIPGRGDWRLARDGETTWIGHNGWVWSVVPESSSVGESDAAHGDLRAPMPGQVLLVHAAVGDQVQAGDPILVLESMKMELVIAAPVTGLVAAVTVAPGDRVSVDQPLAHVEATT